MTVSIEHQGELADGYERESVYVEMQDGCRIAVDVLHPAKGGRRLDGAFPTVLHATPYRRSFVITGLATTAAVYAEELADLQPGDLVTQYEERPIARELIHRGYNFVSMDLRGTGASFGAEFADNWRAGHDIAQVVEWIAAQPWAMSRVGMVGISFEGMVQFHTAAFAPPALACIAPQYPGLPQCMFDGGLAIASFVRTWERAHKGLSENEPSAPVDGPDGETLRAEAQAERSPDAYAMMEAISAMEPRQVTQLAVADLAESTAERTDLGLAGAVGPLFTSAHAQVNAANVPTYLVTGWWDLTFPGHLIDFFNRLTSEKKLLMGAWNHGQGGDSELLRWFDHWLMDAQNGVMDEPPVHFETSEPSGSTVWKSAPRLPLPEAQPRTLYLSSEASGTIASVNDGSLSQAAAPEPAFAKYDVDHGVSLGTLSRHSYYMDDVFIDTVDLVARGRRCLTFTTPPLEAGVEITGSPAVDLEVATTADRGAIVATPGAGAGGRLGRVPDRGLSELRAPPDRGRRDRPRRAVLAPPPVEGPTACPARRADGHPLRALPHLVHRPGGRSDPPHPRGRRCGQSGRADDRRHGHAPCDARWRPSLAAAAADRQPAPRAHGHGRRGRV